MTYNLAPRSLDKIRSARADQQARAEEARNARPRDILTQVDAYAKIAFLNREEEEHRRATLALAYAMVAAGRYGDEGPSDARGE